MKVMLAGANVIDIVDGSEPPPPATASAARQSDYIKRERLAASLIWNSLSSNAQQLVVNEVENPHGMWTTLKERLDAAQNDVAAARIRDQFNQEKWSDKDTAVDHTKQSLNSRNYFLVWCGLRWTIRSRVSTRF